MVDFSKRDLCPSSQSVVWTGYFFTLTLVLVSDNCQLWNALCVLFYVALKENVYWWLYYSLNCVVAMDEGRLATRVMMLQLQKHFQTFPFRTECLKFNYKYVDLGTCKNKYREQRSKFTFLLPLQFSKNWNFEIFVWKQVTTLIRLTTVL